MRTNIDIDDELMKQTMKATGAKTKREAVEAAMRRAVQMDRQAKALDSLWGIAVRNDGKDWDPAYDYKKMREAKGE